MTGPSVHEVERTTVRTKAYSLRPYVLKTVYTKTHVSSNFYKSSGFNRNLVLVYTHVKYETILVV